MLSNLLYWLLVALLIRITAACNPLTTSNCAAIPGLASSTYSIDFTKEKSLPKDWIIADGSDITFGNDGAEFHFKKRKDAANLITNFYVAFGKIDIVMKAAGGTGVISSAVMYSDDLDEIDWEFSGSNFGTGVNNGKVQTNVFGKGITGQYDRGSQPAVSPAPQSSFHKYTINWTPQVIEWFVDDRLVKSTSSNGLNTGNYQHPQTPSRLHLGLWDAGDPSTLEGTLAWSGGYTDYSKGPYTAYVKSVQITTPNPCKSWKYPNNFSGKWADVKCTNEDIGSPSATSSASQPKSTEATYSVVPGDDGWKIAVALGCTLEQLKAANPNVKWDFLEIGQKLNNPNGKAVASSSTSKSSSSSSSSSSLTAKSSSSPTSSIAKSSSTSSSSSSSKSSTSSSSSLSSSKSSSTTTSAASSMSTRGPLTTINGVVMSMRTSNGIVYISRISTITSASPSSPLTTSFPTTTTSSTCKKDDCLNSMLLTQFRPYVSQVCSSYAKTTKTVTFDKDYLMSGCGQNPSRVSSACSCFFNSTSTTTPPITTTSATTASSTLTTTSSITTRTLTTSKSSSTSTKITTTSRNPWVRWRRM